MPKVIPRVIDIVETAWDLHVRLEEGKEGARLGKNMYIYFVRLSEGGWGAGQVPEDRWEDRAATAARTRVEG